jgi:anthranilate phosphoribosyltransferase
MVLGVAKRELGDTFAEVLRLLGVERGLVVCGKEGLDEISPEGETWVSQFSDVRIYAHGVGIRHGGWRTER